MLEKISESRTKNMKAIKNKDTTLEIKVRKYLWNKGFRYKKNDKSLPGTPDIVILKYNVIIFINGCFWHGHSCRLFVLPKTRTDFWKKKIERNRINDVKNYVLLRQLGYRVITVWECEMKEDFLGRMELLIDEIRDIDE